MIDWNMANTIFISGVIVVMAVMLLLQITVSVVSSLVKFYEKRVAKQNS